MKNFVELVLLSDEVTRTGNCMISKFELIKSGEADSGLNYTQLPIFRPPFSRL